MKAKIRIATKEYCYVEFEGEGTPEQVFNLNTELESLFLEKEGLNALDWAKFRKDFFMSEGRNQGSPDDIHSKLNKSQRWWAHQTELTFKSINETE